jgi:hypothetical protein
MYPTIVIILVENQRSMADDYGFSSNGPTKVNVLTPPASDVRTATFGHLSFAGAGQTTVDADTYFQQSRGGMDSQLAVEDKDEKPVGILGKESPNQMV